MDKTPIEHFNYNIIGFHTKFARTSGLKTKKLNSTTKIDAFQSYENKKGIVQLLFTFDEVNLHLIATNTKGKGYASFMLDTLCLTADYYNVSISLAVHPLEDGSDKIFTEKQLFNFYRSRGFKSVGKCSSMLRKPLK